jgi:hypothetical protein
MDEQVRELFSNLESPDDRIRMDALQAILALTEDQVDWVYEVWDGLLDKLSHPNSYQRTIAIRVLCNLAKSDTQDRMSVALPQLLAHTKDEKFITSRQCLQNIWKVALTTQSNRQQVLDHLEPRYQECIVEKHYNLLRQDILQSIVCLYKEESDPELLTMAQALARAEPDLKYRKTYDAMLKARKAEG